jgi:UDP-N-acetylmuramyl pentapeptide phosphotransferase/UDP-N-acetylglucosamine-1-phosphate transferase
LSYFFLYHSSEAEIESELAQGLTSTKTMETEIGLFNYMPILAVIGAFIVSYFFIPVIIEVSNLKRLFDKPTNERKLHESSVPNLGGVAIFGAVFIIFALSGHALQPWSPYLAAGLTILFFSGIKDDILVIGADKKLLLQVIAIVVLMGGGDLVITDLGGVFGLHGIPFEAGVGLTLFTMVVVINAYNLVDGVDGLAGGIGIIASAFFGWWFWEVGMMSHAVLACIQTGALLAFLRYNFEPASIFMGDTGSQIVGYLLAFFAVSFVQTGVTASQPVPFQNEVPVLVISVLIVPLYDTLRVFCVRLYQGKSPFSADRLHVHHQLIDLGFSHRTCCYIIYTLNVAMIALTMSLAGTEVNMLLGIVLLTSVIVFPTVNVKRQVFESVGFDIPSRREIKVLEMKYGIPPKMVENKKNGHSLKKKNGREEQLSA